MEAKNFKIEGLSEKQANEHLKLYQGYCKKIDEIRDKILKAEKDGNATFSDIRELKLEEGFCINAIKLHEWYFENLRNDDISDGAQKSEDFRHIGKGISNEAKKIIEEDFGSFDYWKKEFLACALSARGWVVLAYDWKDDRLHNYIADMHNQGGVWDCIPLLVLDMYEHAYFIDYGTDKKKYIEWFLENINWKVIGDRAQRF